MNMMTGIGSVPSPTRSAKEFLAHETECRSALKPLLDGLLDMAESAGWSRRTAASTLMFLAAQFRQPGHLRAADRETHASLPGPRAEAVPMLHLAARSPLRFNMGKCQKMPIRLASIL
jgi:hypothetical protein